MRYLIHSRRPEPDPASLEGFDSVQFEGDVEAAAGGIGLRPFSREVETVGLPPHRPEGATEEERVLSDAHYLGRMGRRLDALLLLRHHLDADPTAASVRLALAEILEEAGELDEAVAELSQVISGSREAVPALVRRGALYARLGRTGEAETDLRRAVSEQPSYHQGYVQLGLALLRRGVVGESVKVLREALTRADDDPDTVYYLGEALYAQGELPEALGMLQRAAQLSPANPRSYKLMGRLLDRLGQTDEAMAMHRKAREVTIK
jgi:Flp pilus assembly protein TadD